MNDNVVRFSRNYRNNFNNFIPKIKIRGGECGAASSIKIGEKFWNRRGREKERELEGVRTVGDGACVCVCV